MTAPRSALLLLVGALLGASTVGVGLAATSTATVKACADSKGALVLLSKGKCPKKTKGVKVGVTGPTGATGLPGVNGTNGTNGVDAERFSHVVDVDGGGTPAANGTALLAAAAVIGTDSVLRLGPGHYDLAGATLTLPQRVIVQGADQELTKIDDEQVSGAAAVVLNPGSELKDVYVTEKETGAYPAVAVSVATGQGYIVDSVLYAGAVNHPATAVDGADSVLLQGTRVTASTSGSASGTFTSRGVMVGYVVTTMDSSIQATASHGTDPAYGIDNSTFVVVQGGSVAGYGASTGQGVGIINRTSSSGTVTVTDAALDGGTYSLDNTGGLASKVLGGTMSKGVNGAVTCAGVINDAATPPAFRSASCA